MTRWLLITREPIDEAALGRARSAHPGTGAALVFAGLVRGEESGAAIHGIDYEAFEAMARRQFELIFDEVEQRWPIQSVRLVHRIGKVAVTEPSLWVEVCSGHRGEAFTACQYLIDQMKLRVPIWKHPYS